MKPRKFRFLMSHMMCHPRSQVRAYARTSLLSAGFVACSILVGIVLAGPVHATEEGITELPPGIGELETERGENLSALEKLNTNVNASKEALAALEHDLENLNQLQEELAGKLAASAERRDELDDRVLTSEAELTDLTGRQDAVRHSLVARRSLLAEVLGALQRIGRNPPPALLVSPDDALSSVRSAILLGAVVPEIRAETEKLAADLKELVRLGEAIAAERRTLRAALEENKIESERLAALAHEKAALRVQSERRLAVERQRAQSLTTESVKMTNLIASLEKQINDLREEAEAARRAEAERKRELVEQLERARKLAAGLPDKNRIGPAYAFSALKGALVRPVAGQIVRDYGADDGTGNRLSGEVLVTQAGSTVTAPVDGWVVYAGPFRSYGQTLILDVGEGYHLIMAGMDTINVREGQFVLAGVPLATMSMAQSAGSAALALASDKPTLYIEFRRGGKPVDPRSWWRNGTSSGRASNDT